jgi:ribosomal protein S27AE
METISCTAPVEGHTPGSTEEKKCRVHGSKHASNVRRTLPNVPPLARPPVSADALEPIAEDERIVNGLIVRKVMGDDVYVLVRAADGSTLFDARHQSRASLAPNGYPMGQYATPEEAWEWAEKTYPLAVSIASERPQGKRRPRAPRCPDCDRTMYSADTDRWHCPECPGVELDYS